MSRIVTVFVPLHPRHASFSVPFDNHSWAQFQQSVFLEVSRRGVVASLSTHVLMDSKSGQVLEADVCPEFCSDMMSLIPKQPMLPSDLEENASLATTLNFLMAEGLLYQEDLSEISSFCQIAGVKTYRDFKLLTKGDLVEAKFSIGLRNRVLATIALKMQRFCVHPNCAQCIEAAGGRRSAEDLPSPVSNPPTQDKDSAEKKALLWGDILPESSINLSKPVSVPGSPSIGKPHPPPQPPRQAIIGNRPPPPSTSSSPAPAHFPHPPTTPHPSTNCTSSSTSPPASPSLSPASAASLRVTATSVGTWEGDGTVEEINRRKTQMLSQAEMVIKGQKHVTKPVPREKVPDVHYEVIKINNIGRRQARILRLTDTEIQNMRSAQMISSKHYYHEVFCVTLQDYKTFIIHYSNDHEFIYSSPIAGQIVTEINERLVRHRNKEKEHLTTSLASMPLKYHSGLPITASKKEKDEAKKKPELALPEEGPTGPHTEHLTDDNSESEDEGVRSPRVDKEVAAPEDDLALSPKTKSRVNVMEDPTTRDRLIGVLREGAMAPKKKTDSKQNMKLQALTGLSEAQRREQAIDSIILNPDTDVGRARAAFLKNFSVLEKTPSTILGVIRQFMDSLARYFEAKHADAIHAALRGSPESESKDIEVAIEKAITMPIYRRVWDCLLKETMSKEEQLTNKLKILRTKNQPFYGIKKDELSSNNWSSAVYELSLLDKKIMPYEKLEVLLSTARAIYNSYNYERNRRKVEKAQLDGDNTDSLPENFFLAADEFFPIFVFVVVNSTIEHHDVSRQYIWGLCEASMLTGEGGYYLTVYEAAVEYIAGFDLNKT